MMADEAPVLAAARPIIRKPIPPVPADPRLHLGDGADGASSSPWSLVLFYQYVEPPWTKRQHKAAVKFVEKLARKHDVSGRGRCAAEGLNCTLTSSAEGIRSFCQGLRDWDPIFNETDFKFTDGLPASRRFKVLSLKKADELVAYGLAGTAVAPSLSNGGTHLEAHDYHAMLSERSGGNTVVIDVRNAYESAVGHFQPPPGGATLIDPKMRSSRDFPNWLNLPETREKLNGKRVMMYCTGGIRCERATALLNETTATDPNFETAGVYELRGGVERYMKTYPGGGLWRGKNYTFDRRLVQVPESKSANDLKADVESRCVLCRCLWDDYRGKFKCAYGGCVAVPVLVCKDCAAAGVDRSSLRCELCRDGYEAPQKGGLDLIEQKNKVLALGGVVMEGNEEVAGRGGRRDGKRTRDCGDGQDEEKEKKKKRKEDKKKDKASRKKTWGSDVTGRRVFVGRLPFLVTAAQVKEALGGRREGRHGVQLVDWRKDHKTGLFYGSCFALMASASEATRVVEAAGDIAGPGVTIKGSGGSKRGNDKRLKLALAPLRDGEEWPPAGFEEVERPPIV